MLDTSQALDHRHRYAPGKQTVQRPCRLMHTDSSAIMRDLRISGGAAFLLLYMLDHPTNFRFVVNNIVKIRNGDGTPRFGGRNRVLRYIRELRQAGYLMVERDGHEGGGIEAGIYIVASKPLWISCEIDDCTDDNENVEELGVSQTQTKALRSGPLCKEKSIVENDTDTSAHPVENAPASLTNQSETRQAASSYTPTTQSERPQTAAKACSQANEHRSRGAKGSAGKGRGKTALFDLKNVRNIERHRTELLAAGGRALADPRRTPGLWNLSEIMRWLALGYDWHLDILRTITEITGRPGLEPGQVRSWRYFAAAIADAWAVRTGRKTQAPLKYGPRLDPYAPAPRDPDGGTWQQIGLAAMLGRSGEG